MWKYNNNFKIILIFFCLILCKGLLSQPELLIINHDFRNMNYKWKDMKKFFKKYKKNKLTDSQIYYIYAISKKFKINYLVIATKLEQESGVIRNVNTKNYAWRLMRCMGYGLRYKYKKKGKIHYTYGGFRTQVYYGTRLLRYYYIRWKYGKRIKLYCNGKTIIPKNAATYSLYVYCPYYGKYNNCGRKNIGNKLFVIIYDIFSRGRYAKRKSINSIARNN